MEFPGVITKNSCGISMGLGLWPWNFHQRDVTQFCRIRRGESLFSNSEIANLKIPGFFFRKVYISSTPCLEFFWNSPILMKRGRECLACNDPTRLPRSDTAVQTCLAWFSPDVLYTFISQGSLQIRWYCLFSWILQIRQKFVA